MDLNMIQWGVCGGLTLLGLVIVAMIWRRASTRASVWWLGLALLPLGAMLAGAVPAFIDAWNSVALWFQGAIVSTIPPLTIAGLAMLGLGVFLMLISRVIPYKKKTAKATTASTRTSGASVPRTKPDYSGPASSATPSDRSSI